MPEEEKLLPKPLTDLPLPEEEIPANSGVETSSKSKWFKLGIVAVILLVLLSGVYMLANKRSSKPAMQTQRQTVPTLTPTPNLNPNTGTLYGDIKVRLKEVIK